MSVSLSHNLGQHLSDRTLSVTAIESLDATSSLKNDRFRAQQFGLEITPTGALPKLRFWVGKPMSAVGAFRTFRQ